MKYKGLIITCAILGSILIFALVYTLLPDESFYFPNNPSKTHITYGEGFMISTNIQTLLGSGYAIATGTAAVAVTILQAFTTLCIIVVGTSGLFGDSKQ